MSKLKGLKISVAGSSLTTSEVTSNTAVRKLVLIKGKWILPKSLPPEEPKSWAELSMELLILSYPDSIEEFASAYDLIMYAKNKPTKDDLNDIKKGENILKKTNAFDHIQAIVVRENSVFKKR